VSGKGPCNGLDRGIQVDRGLCIHWLKRGGGFKEQTENRPDEGLPGEKSFRNVKKGGKYITASWNQEMGNSGIRKNVHNSFC